MLIKPFDLKNGGKNNIVNFITMLYYGFLFYYTLKYNLFLWCKAEFSVLLLQSSEFILIWYSVIINVGNNCAAYFFLEPVILFYSSMNPEIWEEQHLFKIELFSEFWSVMLQNISILNKRCSFIDLFFINSINFIHHSPFTYLFWGKLTCFLRCNYKSMIFTDLLPYFCSLGLGI